MIERPLIACHECDLLQRETPLPQRGKALCARCGALLYRSHPGSLAHTLALALGALVLFVLANAFPIVSMELKGDRVDATLVGAVAALYRQDMHLLALLVLLTAIVMPLARLGALCALLLPRVLGFGGNGGAAALRLLRGVEPWGMLDVFMLGVLVTLVKLAHVAHVVPGIALWSFGVLILLTAWAFASFDARELWRPAKAP
jgi:paraquat-inducible protein A